MRTTAETDTFLPIIAAVSPQLQNYSWLLKLLNENTTSALKYEIESRVSLPDSLLSHFCAIPKIVIFCKIQNHVLSVFALIETRRYLPFPSDKSYL